VREYFVRGADSTAGRNRLQNALTRKLLCIDSPKSRVGGDVIGTRKHTKAMAVFKGILILRVARGGSFEEVEHCRSANRWPVKERGAASYIGFRIVITGDR